MASFLLVNQNKNPGTVKSRLIIIGFQKLSTQRENAGTPEISRTFRRLAGGTPRKKLFSFTDYYYLLQVIILLLFR